MAAPAACILGLAGLSLSDEEKRFFTDVNPLGFILFARNCNEPDQVKKLTEELRQLLGREDVLVLIDQEGGRVARLQPPRWRKSPPAGVFAEYATQTSLEESASAVYDNARLIARELYALGINVDCAPVADLPAPDAHNIIGDRAYGDEPQQIIVLADAMARGLQEGGVLPVLKHIPGHGRARVDSHEKLPVVDTSLETLRATDFVPFKALSHLPLGMTAHILYTAIDAKRPATLSPDVLKLVRGELGFRGLLMSDDISMKALKGDFATLARESLSAGCDVVLHCNGKMDEMKTVAAGLPPLSEKGQERFKHALALLKKPADFDYAAAEQRLAKAAG